MQLIYSKDIDKSVLCEGFTIQSFFLHIVTEITGALNIGEKRQIKFLMDGRLYDGIVLKNLAFSREKYPTHKEIYQIRYSPNSEFSKALRLLYADQWHYIQEAQKQLKEALAIGEQRKNIKLPEHLTAKIALFTTGQPDIWAVETYAVSDNRALSDSLASLDELSYEQSDDNATISEQIKNVKLRVLDRRIGDNLKRLYGHKCQVCGQAIWQPYGNNPIVDAHHIQSFTQTHNNNFDNIMILCPNHHRIIHGCHGEFHRSQKEIWYPNGLHERLLLNVHL